MSLYCLFILFRSVSQSVTLALPQAEHMIQLMFHTLVSLRMEFGKICSPINLVNLLTIADDY